MTGDRVEAAAKALCGAIVYSGGSCEHYRIWGSECRDHAVKALAAADEADRVAGVVRLDTTDDEFVTSVALSLGFSARSREHDLRMVRRVFDAIRVAAAGAQPLPEGEQR